MNNERVWIKVKKLNANAVLPKNARSTDAGYDIVATDDGTWSEDGRYIEYGTGLSIQLPLGYHAKVAPRSSNSKYDLLLCNSEGLIDNEYRGEIKLRYKFVLPTKIRVETFNDGEVAYWVIQDLPKNQFSIYKKGDRIAQLKIEKTIYAEFEDAAELDETSRGEGGFGSTGR